MASLPFRSWLARAGASLGRALLRWSERVEPKPKIDVMPELRARFPGAPESWLQAIAERLVALGELGIEMPLQAVAPPRPRLRAVPRDEAASVELPQKAKAVARWSAPTERTFQSTEFASPAEARPERPVRLVEPVGKPSARPILFGLAQRARPATVAPSAAPSPRPSRPAVILGRAKAGSSETPIFSLASKAAPADASFPDLPAGAEKPAAEPAAREEASSRQPAEPTWAPSRTTSRRPTEFTPGSHLAAVTVVSIGDEQPHGATRIGRNERPSALAAEWPALPEQYLRPPESSAAIRLFEFRTRLEQLRREQTERLWNG